MGSEEVTSGSLSVSSGRFCGLGKPHAYVPVESQGGRAQTQCVRSKFNALNTPWASWGVSVPLF